MDNMTDISGISMNNPMSKSFSLGAPPKKKKAVPKLDFSTL